ncbi:unnamed protein product [Urochloa humidicola]
MDAMSDDALGLVLERVDSHVSLVRAAAVCRRWRRTIADAAFLHRYRSLHAPPAAGYYHNPTSPWGVDGKLGYAPVFVPSSPPIMDARHLSLDFLPGGAESWSIQDSRSSLLVLMDTRYHGRALPDLAICEPLTQSYRMIPSPPGSDCWGSVLLDCWGYRMRWAVASACPTSGCYACSTAMVSRSPVCSPRAHHGVRRTSTPWHQDLGQTSGPQPS